MFWQNKKNSNFWRVSCDFRFSQVMALKRQWWKVGGGEGNSQGCADRKILVSPRSSNLWNPDCLEFCHPWANLSKLPPAIGNCCKSTDLIVNNNNYCLRVIFCVIQNNQGSGGLITLPKPWLLQIQWNPSFGSHKIWSQTNAHIIFVSVTVLKGHLLFSIIFL